MDLRPSWVVAPTHTTFAGPLTAGAKGGMPLDVFFASDSEEAANKVPCRPTPPMRWASGFKIID